MISKNRALMAHLLRRTGFGANPEELESYLEKGYEKTVEEILHPSDPGNMPDDLIRRYHVEQSELRDLPGSAAYWMYRMISTSCPMEEKIALFWHGLFATGYAKLNQARSLLNQVDIDLINASVELIKNKINQNSKNTIFLTFSKNIL